jgi:dolichol kinase
MREIPRGERGRKAIHYTATLIPLIYHFLVDKRVAIIILGILTGSIMIAELLRMIIPGLRELYLRIFGDLTRPHEHQNNLTGASYVFLGSFMVIWLFPKPIAVIALLFLTVGDSTACLIGMSFGRIRIWGQKTLEGTLAFILSSLLVTWWVPHIPFWVKLIGAGAASILELIPWRFDDNLTIPSLSALVMYFLI